MYARVSRFFKSSSENSNGTEVTKSTAKATLKHELYAWGEGKQGQLGSGTATYRDVPRKVDFFSAKPERSVKHVACGLEHSAIVTEEGRPYSWGSNFHMQLGVSGSLLGDEDIVLVPDKVMPLFENEVNVVDVQCGFFHNLALDDCGVVYSWGNGHFGQLGRGSTLNMSLAGVVKHELESRFVKGVACGAYHSCALTNKGELFTWGNGLHGQLGYNPTVTGPGSVGKSQLVYPAFTNVKEISEKSNLPVQRFKALLPAQVPALTGVQLVSVACGVFHTITLADNGDLYSFGSDSIAAAPDRKPSSPYKYSPISTEDTLYSRAYNDVNKLSLGQKITQISGGNNISAAVTDKGEVYVWDSLKLVPKLVPSLPGKVKQVRLGLQESGVITEDGHLFLCNSEVLKATLQETAPESSLTFQRIFDGPISKVALGWNFGLLLAKNVPTAAPSSQ